MLESLFELRTDATNIASALKLAQASFPEDSAKRIVIVTDGNENLGDARTVARTLADDGIGIDVVPIELQSPGGSGRREGRAAAPTSAAASRSKPAWSSRTTRSRARTTRPAR